MFIVVGLASIFQLNSMNLWVKLIYPTSLQRLLDFKNKTYQSHLTEVTTLARWWLVYVYTADRFAGLSGDDCTGNITRAPVSHTTTDPNSLCLNYQLYRGGTAWHIAVPVRVVKRLWHCKPSALLSLVHILLLWQS